MCKCKLQITLPNSLNTISYDNLKKPQHQDIHILKKHKISYLFYNRAAFYGDYDYKSTTKLLSTAPNLTPSSTRCCEVPCFSSASS